jgi:hypothetical protein
MVETIEDGSDWVWSRRLRKLLPGVFQIENDELTPAVLP